MSYISVILLKCSLVRLSSSFIVRMTEALSLISFFPCPKRLCISSANSLLEPCFAWSTSDSICSCMWLSCWYYSSCYAICLSHFSLNSLRSFADFSWLSFALSNFSLISLLVPPMFLFLSLTSLCKVRYLNSLVFYLALSRDSTGYSRPSLTLSSSNYSY